MNNFSLTQEVGRGKQNIVYKGRRRGTIEIVAVKSIDKKTADRVHVIREFSLLKDIDNKHILKIHEYFETSNHFWYIMEYCNGGDLGAVLKKDFKLPESMIRLFGTDIAFGLHHIHSKGLICCNLKPSNILIDGVGVLKISDFRSSCVISNPNVLTKFRAGTPCYIAPELFSGNVASTKSDLWALGCILYEMKVGRPPFFCTTFYDLSRLILEIEPVPFPDSDGNSTLNDLVFGLLTKDPENRLGWTEVIAHPFWNNILREKLDEEKEMIPEESKFWTVSKMLALEPPSKSTILDNVRYLSGVALRNIESANSDVYDDRLDGNDDISLKNFEDEFNFEDCYTAEDSDISFDSEEDKEDKEEKENDSVEIEEDQNENENENENEKSGEENNSSLIDPKFRIEDDNIFVCDSPDIDLLHHRTPKKSQAGTMIKGRHPNVLLKERERASSAPPKPSHKFGSNLSKNGSGSELSDDSSSSGSRNSSGSGSLRPASSGSNQIQKRGLLYQHHGKSAFSSSTFGTLRSLMFHTSDSFVRPVIALPSDHSPSTTLPFASKTMKEVLKLGQKSLEAFLTTVYHCIVNDRQKINVRVSALVYFGTLCCDSRIADVLVNSSFVQVLSVLLQQSHSSAIQTNVLLVFGLLIRYATCIGDLFYEQKIPLRLLEFTKDSRIRVKRMAVAAVGEFVFFCATQINPADVEIEDQEDEYYYDSENKEISDIIEKSVRVFEEYLLPKTDRHLQLYALKSMDNIATRNIKMARMLTTTKTSSLLADISINGSEDALRITAGSVLVRLSRLNPGLAVKVYSHHGNSLFLTGLGHTNSRIQQFSLNLLNSLLLQSNFKDIKDILLPESGVLESVVFLLVHSNAILKAKALVTIVIVSRISLSTLLHCFELDILPCLEKASKNEDEYVKRCFKITQDTLLEVTTPIISSIVKSFCNTKSLPEKNIIGSNHIKNFGIIAHLVTNSLFRHRVFTGKFIKDIGSIVRNFRGEGKLASLDPADPFKENVFLVLEALSQSSQILIEQKEKVIDYLLDPLTDLILLDHAPTRFLAIRLLIDIILAYLPSSSPKLNDFVLNSLISKYELVLLDVGPIPSFGLKLLYFIVERQEDVNSPIFDVFFEDAYLRKGIIKQAQKLEINAVKLLKFMITLDSTSFAELMWNIFSQGCNNKIESLLDPAMDNIISLIVKLFETRLSIDSFLFNDFFQLVVSNCNFLFDLLLFPDDSIAKKASQIILMSINTFKACSSAKDLLVSFIDFCVVPQRFSYKIPHVFFPILRILFDFIVNNNMNFFEDQAFKEEFSVFLKNGIAFENGNDSADVFLRDFLQQLQL